MDKSSKKYLKDSKNMKNKNVSSFPNGRVRKSSSDDENTWRDQHQNYRIKSNSGDNENECDDVIEIESDESNDAVRNINTNFNNNNEESSPDRHRAMHETEQTSHRDSSQSSSSDVVFVSDDKQSFYEEIEELSRITSRVQLHPEDKVSIKNFKIHKLLGTGAYGKVFSVEKLDGVDKGQIYAMKVLEKYKVTQKKKTTEHTRTEREVLEKVIDCPFLATLYYAFQTSEKLYLIMEFIQGGELFSHLYKSENFEENQVRFYIAEIVVALEQLHELNIIYRDIKLENILLDSDGHIIITDFGLSKELKTGGRTQSYCGTIEYMAPEIVNPINGHDLNVDWWSVGVLIIELLSGQSPFSRENEDSNQAVISERIQNCAPHIPDTIGHDAKDLILKLLEKDPSKRLGYVNDASDIKKHTFFRKINWDHLKTKAYQAPMKPELKDKFDVGQFSEDFTSQTPIDGPVEKGPPLGPNAANYFRGYSFVAPKFRKRTILPDIVERPEMNRPTIEAVFAVQNKSKSAFFKKYRISEDWLIGDGTYSLCMKCICIETKEKFAVKIMKLDHDASQEIDALEKCQGHENIVKLIEKLSDNFFTYIVCELLNGDELFSRIREHNYLTEAVARVYFKQIIDAVSFMHSKSIVHRDLKPENIKFTNDEDSTLKILDFGFARELTSEETAPCFTLDYGAPETFVKGETKNSRDLWSIGVILYTMLCGNTPFTPLSIGREHDERNFRFKITENIKRGNFNMDSDRWNAISQSGKDLIKSLLIVNESERISLSEVKKHPWINVTDEEHTFSNNDITLNCKEIHRIESEETVAGETDDNLDDELLNGDEILINSSETENREETRSNDDSSSGIVMSDRNEGSSSVSSHHEEIEERESVRIYNGDHNTKDNDAFIKPVTNEQELDINEDHVNEKLECLSIDEEFKGFDSQAIDNDDDDDYPTIGFKNDCNDHDACLILFDKLLSNSIKVKCNSQKTPKVLQNQRKQRGRRGRTIKSQILEKDSEVNEIQIEKEQTPQNTTKRRGRQNMKEQQNENVQTQIEMEVDQQYLRPMTRGRKRQIENTEMTAKTSLPFTNMQQIKCEKVDHKSVVVQYVESNLATAANRKTKSRKRKNDVHQENEESKKQRVETRRMVRERRKEIDGSPEVVIPSTIALTTTRVSNPPILKYHLIKPEPIHVSSINLSYQEISHVPSYLNYIDNKDRKSMIIERNESLYKARSSCLQKPIR